MLMLVELVEVVARGRPAVTTVACLVPHVPTSDTLPATASMLVMLSVSGPVWDLRLPARPF